jgi:lipoprotein-releasing system ATP-binding protein
VLLVAKNIHKSYVQQDNVLYVLKNVDLSIESGEVVSIVGPSGAGKSTLLHILGGLDVPNEGQVVLDGEDVYKLNDSKRAQLRNHKVGFVFQFYHLLPEFTALENVVLPALVKEDQKKVKHFEAKAVSLLEQVGLGKRLSHKPYQLSGGEQQRVAIARALMNNPQIVFCDEPTGNLDSANGTQIINVLIELNRKQKQTFVIVTHDEQISKLSHRTIYMKDGELVSEKKNLEK